VPDPKFRPSIDQVLQLLQNWQQIPKINLTPIAQEIRKKNADFGTGGPSSYQN